MENVATKYKRNKLVSTQSRIVMLKFVPVGKRYDQIRDRKTGIYKTTPVTCKRAYIPILETIQYVLLDKSVGQEISKTHVRQNGQIRGFRGGTYYQRHVLFKENNSNIALILYFDEFETVNPLGSKTGGHKIGAICILCFEEFA